MAPPINSNEAPIGVSVVVFHGDSILLGERLKEPNRGLLVVPGGKQNPEDDSPEATANREVHEEAGITITSLKKLMEKPATEGDFVHRITFTAKALDPENVRGGDDLGNPRFYSQSESEELVKEGKISPVVLPVLQQSGFLAIG